MCFFDTSFEKILTTNYCTGSLGNSVRVAIVGQLINLWWKKTDQRWYQEKFRQNANWVYALTFLISGGFIVYLLNQTEVDVFTGRRKFMLIDKDSLKEIADLQTKALLYLYNKQKIVLTKEDQNYKLVLDVMLKLLNANENLSNVEHDWSLVVLKDSSVNAYVMPNGFVFVHSGLLNVAANADQVAVVIAHELAHCIQEHPREMNSYKCLVNFVFLIMALVINITLHLSSALMVTIGLSILLEVFILLPLSRKIEYEADRVGMMLAAKACVDVREGERFWLLIDSLSPNRPLWWLESHPSHQSRGDHLNIRLPEFIEIRQQAKCSRLLTKK
ncbi:metalloendopeptidase OMA1, mitochondrial-like [Daktulosphaira vitifoliae]|uniref:metalloendopeptidase OMA1, mitochondrial-like n=1 Tax=Daktulosphaira vitifoliae TaxID=58002 RepID=UPI0021AAA8CC|nr:metalloendopeptidase OMA1, mitochondrial-like [Daktulosphaira vitifoliae]